MKERQIILSRYCMGSDIFVVHGGRFATYPPYINDCYMAAYIAHGSGNFTSGDETRSASEGDIFVVRPNTSYRITPAQGLRRIDIYFCYFSAAEINNDIDCYMERFPTLIQFFTGDESFIHSADTDNKEIRDIFIRMIDEQFSPMPCTDKALKSYLGLLLVKLFRNTKTRDFTRIYSKNRTVDEAIRFIYERMYTKVSLDDLSSHLHVSPSYVCRVFRENVGMSTSKFINMLRVDKIKDVLKNTDKHVNAVPEMFSCNAEYLKRVFKRETGMTMQEYHDRYHYKSNPSDKEPPSKDQL